MKRGGFVIRNHLFSLLLGIVGATDTP